MCLFVILIVKMFLFTENGAEMAEGMWEYGKNIGHRKAGF